MPQPLHRRFPYADIAGFLFLHQGAAKDGTDKRKSALLNAFPRLRLFTRQADPILQLATSTLSDSACCSSIPTSFRRLSKHSKSTTRNRRSISIRPSTIS